MSRDLMLVTLTPSRLATLVGRHTRAWTGSCNHTHLNPGTEAPVPLDQITDIGLRRRLLWTDLTITHGGQTTTLRGLRHGDANRAAGALQTVVDESRREAALRVAGCSRAGSSVRPRTACGRCP